MIEKQAFCAENFPIFLIFLPGHEGGREGLGDERVVEDVASYWLVSWPLIGQDRAPLTGPEDGGVARARREQRQRLSRQLVVLEHVEFEKNV